MSVHKFIFTFITAHLSISFHRIVVIGCFDGRLLCELKTIPKQNDNEVDIFMVVFFMWPLVFNLHYFSAKAISNYKLGLVDNTVYGERVIKYNSCSVCLFTLRILNQEGKTSPD